MISIKELLNEYKADLLEPLMVLSHILNKDKAYLYTHIDKKLTEREFKQFNMIMEKLKEGWPIQYILKEKEFMGLNFYVDKGVLIPRNDTEILVEYIIDRVKDQSKDIFEIGFGSGAISLSLGHYCKNAKILAVDISDKAYQVASINKERLSIDNVELRMGDLFSGIDEKFDLIVSNPPYINKNDMDKLDPKVRDFEPEISLYGGKDGLDFYRKITKEAKKYLRRNGLLIYEIGYDQAEDLTNILKSEGYLDIEIRKDLSGNDRVALAYWRC